MVPVTKENFEEQKEVETYQREMQPGLFKIWPAKPLEAGEYALVQYTNGELNLRVWDFSCTPAAGAQPAPANRFEKSQGLSRTALPGVAGCLFAGLRS